VKPGLRWKRTLFLAATFFLASCAQQVAPPPPLPKPPLEFLGDWGAPGDGPGQLSDPTDIAVDSVGNIFVSDRGSRFVHKFSPAGTPLLSFQNVSLLEPSCIALDHGDAIYVCDSKRRAVYVFYPTGDFLRVLRAAGMLPASVAVDAEGQVFVAGGRRIFSFTPHGRLGRVWNSKGSPAESLSAENIRISPDGSVFVLDSENLRVQRFSSRGEFLGEWKTGSIEAPRALALAGNSVVLARPGSQMLEVWAQDGRRLFELDLKSHLAPSAEGGEAVTALAASPRGDLFVLVRGSSGPRVLRFRINL
jgi:sugar lactone lactonase YvrE